MAIANTTIQLKKSGAAGNVPTSLNLGELALNYADGKLYYKNASDVITYISSGATTNSFATINANSSLVIATSNTDILSLAGANGVSITANTTSKTVTIGHSGNANFPGFVTVNAVGGAGNQNTSIQIYGANTKGGTGYLDFLSANNQSAGATNYNKWFRLSSTGEFQIINSAYTSNLFNLDDSGNVTVPGNILGGSSSSNYIQFGDGSKQYTANASLSNNQILAGLKTVSSSNNITFDWVAAANNGQGYNFKVGDDVWIGDVNTADTMSIRGQQNAANGYIVFGNADTTTRLGRSGSGPLTYGGGFNATYIQFGDGTIQYTANAGGAGSTDTIARNIAQAAYDQANVTIGVDATQNSRMTIIEGVNTTQNTNITTANNAAWAAYAAGNTNATNITAVNTYAASAYATANVGVGVDATQNTNITTANNAAWAAYAAGNTNATNITSVNTYAASAYALANTHTTQISVIQGVDTGQNTFMQAAFNKANTSLQTTGDQTLTGNLTISKDLSVTGNLIVLGNTIAINTSSFTVVDSLITLGIGNYTTDVLDIGFAGHYNDGTNAHSGIIRDAVTKDWYIFKGYTPELNANNNVDINDASFRKANVNFDYGKGNLIATTATVNGWDVSSVWSTQNTNITSVNTYAGSAYAQANATAGGLVTANTNITVIQGVDTAQNTRMTVIEGVDATQNTNITTANNAAWAAYAAGNTNATDITAVNTYAASAYAQANTDYTTISIIANTTSGTGITVPQFTVQANGRISAVTNVSIRSATTGLTGIVKLTDVSSTSTSEAATINFASGVNSKMGSAYAQANVTAGGLVSANANIALLQVRANTDYTTLSITATTSSSNGLYVPVVTVTANGRVSSISNTAIQSGTTSVVGVVSLTDSVTSTDTTTAATPNSVKIAYDRAQAAFTQANTGGSSSGVSFAQAMFIATSF